ncbi:MAG: 30S ribosome-binding factor RbfA [Rhodospirillales bacterium]|nr:30S ribosome-binding factor RbfA [Rhodospirillales bacterium]MCB9973539.1 30S ribosome-binding factor RbfA [Rhodospirillales bacterium]
MKNAMPSQRQLRMGEQVRHILSETLRRGKFHDPILMDTSLLSVNEVRMTPDLRHAKAYVSLLHGENLPEILEALNRAAAYFQSELNRKIDVKFTPKVSFVEDIIQGEVNRLEEIFHNLPKAAPEDD